MELDDETETDVSSKKLSSKSSSLVLPSIENNHSDDSSDLDSISQPKNINKKKKSISILFKSKTSSLFPPLLEPNINLNNNYNNNIEIEKKALSININSPTLNNSKETLKTITISPNKSPNSRMSTNNIYPVL